MGYVEFFVVLLKLTVVYAQNRMFNYNRNDFIGEFEIVTFYFILSSEINAYQKQIKVILITSEMIWYTKTCPRGFRQDFFLSCDMWFPTMWYVRPAKPQISLRICKYDYREVFWSTFVMSLWESLEYSMSVKLLTEHHLEFQGSKEAPQARLSLHLSKWHIVRKHMSRLLLKPKCSTTESRQVKFRS